MLGPATQREPLGFVFFPALVDELHALDSRSRALLRQDCVHDRSTTLLDEADPVFVDQRTK